MQTPTAQIPLSIPYSPTAVHQNLVQPPPLPQLKPFGLDGISSANKCTMYVPPRIQARLDELGITDPMFLDLLNVYEYSREDYIELLKKGFLVFFPYLLGSRWRKDRPNSVITGKNYIVYTKYLLYL